MKITKNLILLFFLTWIVSSCFQDIDDTKIICTENCTIFSGKVQTEEGEGISGIDVLFKYKESGGLFGSSGRKIAKTKTDSDGYYRIAAYLKDKELGDTTQGYFILTLNTRQVSQKVSEEYLKPDEILIDGNVRVVFHTISDRNYSFENSFIVPKKGFFKIKLHNFEPILEDDYFKVSVDYHYLFLSEGWGGVQPWQGLGDYAVKDKKITEIIIPSAIGDSTRVIVTREKNGVVEREEKYVKLKNSTPYTMDFFY